MVAERTQMSLRRPKWLTRKRAILILLTLLFVLAVVVFFLVTEPAAVVPFLYAA